MGQIKGNNHTGRFLTQWQMAEARRDEAILNSRQKREGTNFCFGNITAWSCGCCIGPCVKSQKVLTAEQADAVLKARKHTPKETEIDWSQPAWKRITARRSKWVWISKSVMKKVYE